MIILITFNLHMGGGFFAAGQCRLASLRPLYFSVMFSPFSTKFHTNHIISDIIIVISKRNRSHPIIIIGRSMFKFLISTSNQHRISSSRFNSPMSSIIGNTRSLNVLKKLTGEFVEMMRLECYKVSSILVGVYFST